MYLYGSTSFLKIKQNSLMSPSQNSYEFANLLIKSLLKSFYGFMVFSLHFRHLILRHLIIHFRLICIQDKTCNLCIYYYEVLQKEYQKDFIMSLT